MHCRQRTVDRHPSWIIRQGASALLVSLLSSALLTPDASRFDRLTVPFASEAQAAELFVIAGSPSLRAPLIALAQAFESEHPGVDVKISLEAGLELRRTIALLENQGERMRGRGPVHIVAPGGDELITRLAQKQYVLPETRTLYATRPLVLVVPESLVEAPAGFEAALSGGGWRVAVADPAMTPLGQETGDCIASMGLARVARLDVAIDARAVLDHVLRGEADAGIVFGPEAAQERDRVRVVAAAPVEHHRPQVLSMAVERQCPSRTRCEEFLAFVRSVTARELLAQLGYGPPP